MIPGQNIPGTSEWYFNMSMLRQTFDNVANKASDPAYQAKLKDIPAGAPVSHHHESQETTPPTQAADTVSLSSTAQAGVAVAHPPTVGGHAQSGPAQATEYGYKPIYQYGSGNNPAKYDPNYGKPAMGKPIYQYGSANNPAKYDPNYVPPDDAQKQMQKAKDKAYQDLKNGDASKVTVTYDENGNIKSVGEDYTEQGSKKGTGTDGKPTGQPGPPDYGNAENDGAKYPDHNHGAHHHNVPNDYYTAQYEQDLEEAIKTVYDGYRNYRNSWQQTLMSQPPSTNY